MSNKTAVIIDAIRTPIGALGGILASLRPDDMAALVIRNILARNQFDPASVEEVFFGCANQAGEDNRNVDVSLARLDGARCLVDGVESRSAQTVHGHTADFKREAR